MTSSWSRITDSSSQVDRSGVLVFQYRTFPEDVRGKLSTNNMQCGILKREICVPVPQTEQLFVWGNLISHLLSPGLCRMLLSPRTGGLALLQPLICQSDQLGDEQRNRTVLMTHSLFHIIFLSTVWRCVSVSCCPPEVPVPPAPPVLWDVCVETAPSQQGGCSRLLGWSRPSDVLHNAAATQTVQTVCVTDYM